MRKSQVQFLARSHFRVVGLKNIQHSALVFCGSIFYFDSSRCRLELSFKYLAIHLLWRWPHLLNEWRAIVRAGFTGNNNFDDFLQMMAIRTRTSPLGYVYNLLSLLFCLRAKNAGVNFLTGVQGWSPAVFLFLVIMREMIVFKHGIIYLNSFWTTRLQSETPIYLLSIPPPN